MNVKPFFCFLAVVLVISIAVPVFAQTPQIVSTSPSQNEMNVPISTNISVAFDSDMNQVTITNSTYKVNARSTGRCFCSTSYNSETKTATFTPLGDFAEGEVVTVTLTSGIQSSGGAPLYPHVWSFTIVADDGSGTFATHSVYGVGNDPWSVFAADLDDDGDLDLATANAISDDVSVLLNNGDGTFADDSVYTVGDEPLSVFAADLDGDGDLDLATANASSDDVSVLLNNGNGIFADDSVYGVGNYPRSVFAADLNGDGHLDLATANRNSDSVSVLLNDGNGTFATHTDYAVGDYPYSVFAADLNGDGHLDLATANWSSGDVSVLLNDGNGTFPTHTDYGVGGAGPFSVFAADLDGDGDLDLATAVYMLKAVSVFLNDGDGTFPTHTVYGVGGFPFSVFAADLDGDGVLDLVTANPPSDDVSVLLGIEVGLPQGTEQSLIPRVFALWQNYPNPFNPITQIKYALPKDSHVKLTIYNVLGQKVATLVDEKEKAGYKTARWDAGSLSSGIYFYRLQAGDFVQTRKMVLIR